MSDISDKSSGRLLTVRDLQQYKPPPVWHIVWGGILDVGSRMIIFGDEGTWKSAIVMHGSYCFARGSKWIGFRTSPANILYVQGEMSISQTKERMEQYCEGSKSIYLSRPGDVPTEVDRADKYAYPDNIVIEKTVQDLNLDTMNGYQFLRNEIELMITEMPENPIILIADPLFKMFRYDLVKEDDLRAFTSNIDKLIRDPQLFKNHPGMAAVIVHHTRKPQQDMEGHSMHAPGSIDMFGSAHLKWWADTIIRSDLVASDDTDSTIRLTFTKHRLAKYPPPKEIVLYWDRETYHPYIERITKASVPEDHREFRGVDLGLLE